MTGLILFDKAFDFLRNSRTHVHKVHYILELLGFAPYLHLRVI